MNGLTGGVFVALWIMLTLALLGWAQNVIVALFFSLVSAFALFGGYRYNRQPQRWMRAMRAMRGISVGAGVLFALLTLLKGWLLSALLVLVVFLLPAMSFTLASRREVFMLILASIGLMLYAVVQRESATLWLVLYLFSVVLVLMQLQLSQVRQQVAQYRGVGSTLAAVPVFVTILLLSALLYKVLPQPEPPRYELLPQGAELRYSDRLWESLADRQSGRSGGGGSGQGGSGPAGAGRGGADGNGGSAAARESALTIGQAGEPPPPRLLLRVEGDGPPLLRTLVFDRFDGSTWSRSHPAAGDRFYRLNDGVFSREAPRDSEPRLQRIEVVAAMDGALPLSPYAYRIELPATVLRIDAQDNVYLPGRLEPGLRYEVLSARSRVDGRRLFPGEAAGADWLQLPEEAPPLCALSQELAYGREPLAVANQVEHHLLHEVAGAASALAPEPLSRDWLDPQRFSGDGLTRAQKLSLMVLMMRCEGVPARIAAGYSSDLQNPLTGVWDVTGEHASIWSEIYLPGQGWVVFAVNDEPGVEPGSWAERALDYVKQSLKRDDLSLTERLGLYCLKWVLELVVALEQASPAIQMLVAGAGLLLLLSLFLLWYYRRAIRDRWLERRLAARLAREPDAAVIHLFAALERWMGYRSQRRLRHETASAWLARLGQDFPWLGELLPLVDEAFNRQRYGVVEGAMDAARARQWWREFRRLAARHGWNLKG